MFKFLILILLLFSQPVQAAKLFTMPDTSKNDGNYQFQIGNQKYPAGWLKTASDAELIAIGVTYQGIADAPANPTGILLLGDSITAYGDTAPNSWATTLGFTPIINGGVPSDTTTGMLSRLPTLLSTYKPRAVFLLGGVNDLSLGVPEVTTVSNIKQIISLSIAAGAVIYVQAILPVASCYSASPNVTNSTITTRNAAIHAGVLSVAGGQWINWGASLTNFDYADCIHLVTSGYTKWNNAITPYINLYR